MYKEISVYYGYLAGEPIAIFPSASGSAIDAQCCLCVHDGEVAPIVMIEPLLLVLKGLSEVPESFKETVRLLILNPIREVTFEEMKQLNFDRELKWIESHYANQG